MKRYQILLVLLLFINFFASGQPPSPTGVPDTLKVKSGDQIVLPDTTFIAAGDTTILLHGEKAKVKENPFEKSVQFYDSLEDRADKRKLTRELYELIIKDPKPEPTIDSAILKSEDSFKKYRGFIIRSIHIKKVDLLEGSVLDTTLESTTRVAKLVNRAHQDTRDFIIRNNLLFEVGDPVDPYQLADNERVLRQFKTIRDARIYLKADPDEPGVVDVTVVTQDVASIGASGSYGSLGNFKVDLYHINILGYAKQLQLSYFRNEAGTPVDGFEITLKEPNIGHTFIQGEIKYTNNYLRNRLILSAGRDFLTPATKYAGGLELFKTKESYLINRNDTLKTPYTQESADLWAGRSFQVSSRTNLILSVRTNTFQFTERPFISADSNHFFFKRNFTLATITLFKTSYFKGSLITGFGKTEDVPVNTWVGMTFGNEHNEFSIREYVEWRSGLGRYLQDFGYFSADFSLGGFYRKNNVEDGVLNLNGIYFSNLFKIKRARVRQFVNFAYTSGFNRTVLTTIGIPGSWRDAKGFVPLGIQRISVGMETVYFTPWYFYGFKFALYHGADVHFLTTNAFHIHGQHVFASVKGGIRMLNDNLVFPRLSVDLDYFIRSEIYRPRFAVSVSTTLPRLFGTSQRFKPEVASFH